MKKTGYIKDNGNNPEKIEERKKLLIEAGCEEVIIERVESLDGETPELDGYLESVREGDCLMTVNIDSLSRNIVTCRNVIHTLAKGNATFITLDGSFDPANATDELVLNVRAAVSNYRAPKLAKTIPSNISQTMIDERLRYLVATAIYEWVEIEKANPRGRFSDAEELEEYIKIELPDETAYAVAGLEAKRNAEGLETPKIQG